MSSSKGVIEFRKRIKTALVEAFGGHCQVCGEKHPEFVFDFHHLNPSDKSFNIGSATTIDNRNFLQHKHYSGDGTTGGVV